MTVMQIDLFVVLQFLPLWNGSTEGLVDATPANARNADGAASMNYCIG